MSSNDLILLLGFDMDDKRLMELYDKEYYDSLLSNKAFNPEELLVSHIPSYYPKIPMKPSRQSKKETLINERWNDRMEDDVIHDLDMGVDEVSSMNKYRRIEEMLEDIQNIAEDL